MTGGFVRSATGLARRWRRGDAGRRPVNPRYLAVGVPSVVSSGQSLVFYSLPYVTRTGRSPTSPPRSRWRRAGRRRPAAGKPSMPARIVLLVTSPRLPAGLLTAEAWDVVRAHPVLAGADSELTAAVRRAGVPRSPS